LPSVREIAAYFPMVHSLSLNVPDQKWAATANSIFASAHTDNYSAPDAIRRLFKASPFGIEQCVKAHSLVWLGKSEKDIRRMYA
jgi:hypothetical protein